MSHATQRAIRSVKAEHDGNHQQRQACGMATIELHPNIMHQPQNSSVDLSSAQPRHWKPGLPSEWYHRREVVRALEWTAVRRSKGFAKSAANARNSLAVSVSVAVLSREEGRPQKSSNNLPAWRTSRRGEAVARALPL